MGLLFGFGWRRVDRISWVVGIFCGTLRLGVEVELLVLRFVKFGWLRFSTFWGFEVSIAFEMEEFWLAG